MASPAALKELLRSCQPALKQSRLKLQRLQQSEIKPGSGRLHGSGSEIMGSDSEIKPGSFMSGRGIFIEGIDREDSGRFH